MRLQDPRSHAPRPTAPARLYPLRPHPVSDALMTDPHRFKVVPAGRRSGKTEKAKRKLVVEALTSVDTPWPDPKFFAAAPTRDQAKRIYWEDLKAMSPRELVADVSESHLTIWYTTGSLISVLGMDKPERVEGSPWDGGVLDEYANMKAKTWPEHVRPAMSDRRGWCWFIGVPEGRNHYYHLNQKALSGAKGWKSYGWPSSDILPPEEIEAAKADLDELVFQQEYEASFVNFVGRAYYNFVGTTHCAPLSYDPERDLGLCFDFNVDPGVAVVVQEQDLPGQYERGPGGLIDLSRPVHGTGVIGEVWIPQNSNTPAVCRRLLRDWGKHRGRVHAYGDATGGARGTAQTEGSDWDIIRRMLRDGYRDGDDWVRGFGDRVHFDRVPASNPAERARVNAVNTRLKSANGTIRLMADPARAPKTVIDLEGVRVLEGGSGEIDKKRDPLLTHLTDGLGYYVENRFPALRRAATVKGLRA
jgi:hypothetical protein